MSNETSKNTKTIRLVSGMINIAEYSCGYNSKNCVYNEPGYDNVINFSAYDQFATINVDPEKNYKCKVKSLMIFDKYDNNITEEAKEGKRIGFMNGSMCELESGKEIDNITGEVYFVCTETRFEFPIKVYINADIEEYE